jgi:hypothetical protein
MMTLDADHPAKLSNYFWEKPQYTDAEQALKAWFRETSSAD